MLLYIISQFLSKRNSTTRRDFKEMIKEINDLAGLEIISSQVTEHIVINQHIVYIKQKEIVWSWSSLQCPSIFSMHWWTARHDHLVFRAHSPISLLMVRNIEKQHIWNFTQITKIITFKSFDCYLLYGNMRIMKAPEIF